jgi:hypothetical protein
MTHSEAVGRLGGVLMEAASQHMISDVPVGVFLSGGIDSSSVVAALASQGHALHTFSVAFDEQEFDESQYARQVADQFGTEHTELRLSPREILNQVPLAVDAYDQPSGDGINTYFIRARFAGGDQGRHVRPGWRRVVCRLSQFPAELATEPGFRAARIWPIWPCVAAGRDADAQLRGAASIGQSPVTLRDAGDALRAQTAAAA